MGVSLAMSAIPTTDFFVTDAAIKVTPPAASTLILFFY